MALKSKEVPQNLPRIYERNIGTILLPLLIAFLIHSFLHILKAPGFHSLVPVARLAWTEYSCVSMACYLPNNLKMQN